jgi:hypothetical protein
LLALVAGFVALGAVDARAEAPDGLAGDSCGSDCGVAWPHSGGTLLAAHWPAAKASAASRDPFWVTLLGAWHVLVHYEVAAASGAAERWDDRAWVFEKAGDRLRWTEYPIVVFDDETGRFESDEANRASRVLHHWQPDDAQLTDIQDGLAVNDRGMSSTTLRLSEGSWVSGPKQATASASVIHYDESWSIDLAAEGPVFKREDALRSELAGVLSGVTVYTTRETADGGRLLRGDFERDGSQSGTFTMMRAAGVRGHGD